MGDDEKINIDKKPLICRVCINEIEVTGKSYYLFQTYEDILSLDNLEDLLIADKINACVNLEIEENDGLPDRICSSCLVELEDAYNFKRKCEKSDDALRIAAIGYIGSPGHDIVLKEEEKIEFEDRNSDEVAASLSELQLNDDDKLESTKSLLIENTKPSHEDILPITEVKLRLKHTKNQPSGKGIQVTNRNGLNLNVQCNDCGSFFKNKFKMRVHWKTNHFTTFTCPNCRKVSKTYKSFKNHLKNQTKLCQNGSKICFEYVNNLLVMFCKDCDFSTKNRTVMGAHLVIHTAERKFTCDLCTKSYKHLQQLKFHKESSHKQFLGQKTCDICGEFIIGLKKFSLHMAKHRRKKLQCDLCKKFYSTRLGLVMHFKRHSKIKEFPCNMCSYAFYTGYQLHLHRKGRHEPKDPKNSCSICGYCSSDKYVNKKHEKKHHAGNVCCSICGKFVENETLLALHKICHTNRQFNCEYCIKDFYSRKSLLTHVRKVHKVYISRGIEVKKTKIKMES